MPLAISVRVQFALKAGLFAVALLPFLRLAGALAFDWFGGLGSNPIELLTRSTGTWTLVMLCVTLAITPLRKITGWQLIARWRRMLGLFAFFYALLHFITYVWFDQWFDVTAIAKDIYKRPFITAGFTALVLMTPLAITSTNAMMKRLGRKWATLHKLVYLVVPIGVLHYWWMKAGKNAIQEPAIYALVVALLLGCRVALKWQAKKTVAAKPAATASQVRKATS